MWQANHGMRWISFLLPQKGGTLQQKGYHDNLNAAGFLFFFFFLRIVRVWVMNSSEYTQPKRYLCASMESPLASMLSCLKPSDLTLWRCLLKCKYSIENNCAIMEEWDSSIFWGPIMMTDLAVFLQYPSTIINKKHFPPKTRNVLRGHQVSYKVPYRTEEL